MFVFKKRNKKQFYYLQLCFVLTTYFVQIVDINVLVKKV